MEMEIEKDDVQTSTLAMDVSSESKPEPDPGLSNSSPISISESESKEMMTEKQEQKLRIAARVRPNVVPSYFSLKNSIQSSKLIEFEEEKVIRRYMIFSGFALDFHDFAGFEQIPSSGGVKPWTRFPVRWKMPELDPIVVGATAYKEYIWMDVWSATMLGLYTDIPVKKDSYKAEYNPITGLLTQISVMWDIFDCDEVRRREILKFAFQVRASAVSAHNRCAVMAKKVKTMLDEEQALREKDLDPERYVSAGFDVKLRKTAIRKMREGKPLMAHDIDIKLIKRDRTAIEDKSKTEKGKEKEKEETDHEKELAALMAVMKEASDAVNQSTSNLAKMMLAAQNALSQSQISDGNKIGVDGENESETPETESEPMDEVKVENVD